MKPILFSLFVLALLGSGYYLFFTTEEPVSFAAVTDFPEATLERVDSGTETLKGPTNKLVVFVNEKCDSCHKAMEALQSSNAVNEQTQVYYIWESAPKDIPTSTLHPNMKNLLWDSKVLPNKLYGVKVTPHFYLLDESNNVIMEELGYSEALLKKLERKVAAK
jgi:thioredoxin-related protein